MSAAWDDGQDPEGAGAGRVAFIRPVDGIEPGATAVAAVAGGVAEGAQVVWQHIPDKFIIVASIEVETSWLTSSRPHPGWSQQGQSRPQPEVRVSRRAGM